MSKSRDFRLNCDVLKRDDSQGLVMGWGIICTENGERYFDVQKDHIPDDAMFKSACDFMANSRMASDMHSGKKVGTIVFAWPMTAEIAKAFGIETDKTGLMVAMRPSPELLAKFQSGEYTGFSIGGKRIKDEVDA
jgi:hypothetical protein